MPKLTWDKAGERFYETGVSKVAVYPHSDIEVDPDGNVISKPNGGIAWNGVTAITESPSGAEATPLYADNIKYLNLVSTEEFSGTIEAYSYPFGFERCIGEDGPCWGISFGQQPRKTFDLCYVTKLGNDTDGTDHGYKLHIVYNCLVAPSERAYATINDSPEATTFSWEFTTTPVDVPGHKPTAHIIFDSTKFDPTYLKILEERLYGTDDPESIPYMMTPENLFKLIDEVVNGKG